MHTTTFELEALLAPLLRRRPMGANHYAQLLQHLRAFAAQTCDSLDAFNDANVNDWLSRHVLPSKQAGKTKRAYRASILNAWRTAYLGGLVDRAPGVVVPVPVLRQAPRAWTLPELRRLREVCGSIAYGDWAAALIELTWSTGLRRCDAYDLDTSQIGNDGVYRLVQQKTGVAHACHVSADALRALDLVGGSLSPLSRSLVSRIFLELRAEAGLSYGTARWLRRSAASYVERERPGRGVEFLGHKSQSVAARHYFDPAITASFVRGPAQRLTVATSIR